MGDTAWKSARAKLDEEDVMEIVQLLINGCGATDLAEAFGVAHTTISEISTGKRWTHIVSKEDIKRIPRVMGGKLRVWQVREIKKRLADEPVHVLASDYGVHPVTIERIRDKKTWKEV